MKKPLTDQVGGDGAKRGRSKSEFCFRLKNNSAGGHAQPKPFTPGISRQMVRNHARRLFRDTWPQQALSANEWHLAERDLVRVLEADAL